MLDDHAAHHPHNVLTDGQAEVTYGKLRGLFAMLDEKPGSKNVRCFSFPAGNKAVDAVIILWLLYGYRNFILLPATRTDGQDLTPGFCDVKIIIGKDAKDIEEQISNIRLEENEGFKEAQEFDGSAFFRTSGTTANPKYVRHSINKLYGNGNNFLGAAGISSEDKVLIPVPLYHMYGFGAALIAAVIAGASIHFIENTNVIKLIETERAFAPDVLFLTPLLCHMLLQAKKNEACYKLTVTAGDRIKKETFEAYEEKFGRLMNLYGSTELGVVAVSDAGDELVLRSDGVVKPLPGVEVLEDDAMNTEDGTQFRVRCRHPYGFEFYVDADGKKIGDVGIFDTSDIGLKTGHHTFRIVDRISNSVNRNGFLVAFSEIESSMEMIEGVEKVIVAAKKEETVMGKKLVAFCKTSGPLSAEDIRQSCMKNMPRHIIPDEVQVVDDFPKTASGKIDRRALQASF